MHRRQIASNPSCTAPNSTVTLDTMGDKTDKDVKAATDREKGIDTSFGHWLESHRASLDLTIAAAAALLGMKDYRLIELERGAYKKGVTRSECHRIAVVYNVDYDVVIYRALGEVH